MLLPLVRIFMVEVGRKIVVGLGEITQESGWRFRQEPLAILLAILLSYSKPAHLDKVCPWLTFISFHILFFSLLPLLLLLWAFCSKVLDLGNFLKRASRGVSELLVEVLLTDLTFAQKSGNQTYQGYIQKVHGATLWDSNYKFIL